MRYLIYTYQPAGFSAGWIESEADAVPKGSASVPVWDRTHADTKQVYCVDTTAAEFKENEKAIAGVVKAAAASTPAAGGVQ